MLHEDALAGYKKLMHRGSVLPQCFAARERQHLGRSSETPRSAGGG